MPKTGARVRVVVADDHPFFRDGVSRALTLNGQVEVVAEAATGRETIEAIQREQPDVALVDYEMPDLDGVAVVHAVVRDQLPTRVLLLIRLRSDAGTRLLSEREQQVLRGFARGLSVPQVASELLIGVSTVKTHTQRLYEKLGVSDRAAAVAEGMRRGLLE